MNRSLPRLTAFALACAASGLATAQTTPAPSWTTTASATGVLRTEADIDDSAAKVRTGIAALRLGTSTQVAPGLSLGASFAAESLNYSFTGVSPLAWGDVERFSVSAPIVKQTADGWIFLATPTVGISRESGAAAGDSLVWGSMLGAIKAWGPDRQLGLGVEVLRRFEQTQVIPLVFVDWNLGGGWSIANPLPAGPTGPAGLELRYRFSPALTGGVGATWRSFAFRLDDQPGRPAAVAFDQGWPVFAQLSYAITPAVSLQVAAGVQLGARLEVQNNSGDTLVERDLGKSALLGFNLRGRF